MNQVNTFQFLSWRLMDQRNTFKQFISRRLTNKLNKFQQFNSWRLMNQRATLQQFNSWRLKNLRNTFQQFNACPSWTSVIRFNNLSHDVSLTSEIRFNNLTHAGISEIFSRGSAISLPSPAQNFSEMHMCRRCPKMSQKQSCLLIIVEHREAVPYQLHNRIVIKRSHCDIFRNTFLLDLTGMNSRRAYVQCWQWTKETGQVSRDVSSSIIPSWTSTPATSDGMRKCPLSQSHRTLLRPLANRKRLPAICWNIYAC